MHSCLVLYADSVAMVKVTGAFQKSTEIMKTTNQLVKLPQLNATMREMSMEMMKVCHKSLGICMTPSDIYG